MISIGIGLTNILRKILNSVMPPENTVAPSISSTGVVGDGVTGTAGSYSGTPTLSYEYQSFNEATGQWVPIPDETGINLTEIPSSVDGREIRLKETATSLGGSTITYSNTIEVTMTAPTITDIGAITGTPTIGSTITHTGLTLGGGGNTFIIRDWLGNGVSLGVPNSADLLVTEDLDGVNISVFTEVTNTGGTVSDTTATVTGIFNAPVSAGDLDPVSIPEDELASEISFAAQVSVDGDADLSGGTWSVQAGTVPDGLTRSGGVILSGTPTTPAAEQTLTLRYTNSGGFVDVSCNITVTAAVTEGVPSTSAALWWDIQDLTTLWTTTGRSVNSGVGDQVAYIDDKIGNYDFSLVAGSAILRQDATTGKYYIEVATNTHASILNATSYARNISGAALFAAVDNNDVTGTSLVAHIMRGTNNSGMIDLRFQDGVPEAGARRTFGDAGLTSATWAGGVVSDPCVIATIVDWGAGNAVKIRVNGVDGASSALPGSGNTQDSDGLGGNALNFTTLASDLVGNFYGMVGFRTLPTTDEITTVEEVLTDLIIGPPSNSVAPLLSGVGEIGEEVSTTTGTFSPTPDAYEYRWMRDGVEITDATLSTYTFVDADDETDITSEVRAQKNGQWSSWIPSSNTLSVIYPAPVLTEVIISPSFGSQSDTFSFTYDGDIPGSSITQQWQMDGVNISGATGATHQPTSDGQLTVEVTATNSGGNHTLESEVVVIISGDIFGVTQGGNASNAASYNAPFPAYESGDLLILVAGIEAEGKTLSFPTETSNGEAIFPITANHSVAGSDITLSAVGWIGTGSRSAGTINVAVTGGSDQFGTAVLHLPAGVFDDASPIDSIALGGSATLATSSNTPSWTVTNNNSTIVHVIMADGTPPNGIGAGYTANNIWDPGSVAVMVASRDTRASASEVIPPVAITFPSNEVWSGISFAFNINGSPTLTRVPDCVVLPVASVASGTLGEIGNAISTTTGTWIGSPSSTEYRWLRNGSVISGQTTSSYTPVSGDAGTTIVPQVRRINSVGNGAWTSASNSVTIISSATAPQIAVLPQQFYTEDTGIKTLDVSSFTTGDAPITYSRTPTSAAVTINSTTGVLSIDTQNVIDTTTFTITATNSEGSGQRTVDVQVTTASTSGFFVDNNGGSNSNNGSIGSPWATLQFAVDQLNPGDTLNIRQGSENYGGFNCNVSGTVSQPITIQGYPGERPVIDGRVATGLRGAISMEGRSNLVFRNYDVKEGRSTAGGGTVNHCTYVGGVSGQVCGNILFENIKASDTDHSGWHIVGLQTGQTIPKDEYRTKGITIRNCETTNTNRSVGQESITVGGGVEEIIIEDCHIHNNNRYGIDCKLGVRKIIIRRCSIHDNSHHGIYMDAASRVIMDFYIYDCEIYNNSTTGITLARESTRDPGTHVKVQNGWIWNNRIVGNDRGFQVYRHGPGDTTTLGDIDNINFFHNSVADNSSQNLNLTGDTTWVNAVVSNFHIHNCIFNGVGSLVNNYTTAPGYSYSNNVTSNPSFVNRAASPPNLHIPSGSTADGAGSASWDPASALSGASAWFLANATVTNTDADDDTYANPPASGAYEAD